MTAEAPVTKVYVAASDVYRCVTGEGIVELFEGLWSKLNDKYENSCALPLFERCLDESLEPSVFETSHESNGSNESSFSGTSSTASPMHTSSLQTTTTPLHVTAPSDNIDNNINNNHNSTVPLVTTNHSITHAQTQTQTQTQTPGTSDAEHTIFNKSCQLPLTDFKRIYAEASSELLRHHSETPDLDTNDGSFTTAIQFVSDPMRYGEMFEDRSLRLYNQLMQDHARPDSFSTEATISDMRYRRICTLHKTSSTFLHEAKLRNQMSEAATASPVYLACYLRGRLDAMSHQKDLLVEVKNRIQGLFHQPKFELWPREWIQIQTYLHMTDTPIAHIMECCWLDDRHADVRILEISRRQDIWDNLIEPSVQALMYVLYEMVFMATTETRISYMLKSREQCNTWLTQQIQMYMQLILLHRPSNRVQNL